MTETIKAILDADVVNFTKLMAEDGTSTLRSFAALMDTIVEPVVAEHSGFVFKRTGDGFLACFPTNKRAAFAATTIHELLAKAREEGDSLLNLRIGIDCGDVEEDGDRELSGLAIIRAVRAEGAAEPNTTLVTDGVRQSLDRATGLDWRDTGEHVVKHGERIRLYEITRRNPLAIAEAVHVTVRRGERRGTTSRISFGMYADALTYSNIGLHIVPSEDSRTVEVFDAIADGLIEDFVRTLPGCEAYSALEAGDDVLLTDADIATVAQFDGRIPNGIEVRVDGTVVIRFALVGAHFLYDVMRTLCSGFAIAHFLRTTFRTVPTYRGTLGYRVVGDSLYPATVALQPYRGDIDLDVGELPENVLATPLVRWSRTAWHIKFTSAEATAQLRKFIKGNFPTNAGLRVSQKSVEQPCFGIAAEVLDIDQARREGVQSSQYQIKVHITHVRGAADYATLVAGEKQVAIGPVGADMIKLLPLAWHYGQPTTNVPLRITFEYGNAEWTGGFAVVELEEGSNPPKWSYAPHLSRLPAD